MSSTQVTATWVFYMLSLLRRRHGLVWEDFDAIQQKYNLATFLMKQYELLHYYDNDYILDDISRYISEQGGDLRELQRAN
jgi:hypothetical protein